MEKFDRDVMSSNSVISLLVIEEDGIEAGFGERGLVDFVLEVEEKLRSVTAFSVCVLEQ